MNDSLEKINSSIQYALSFIIRDEYPESIVSLTSVNATPDLEYADVLISVLQDGEKMIEKLSHQSAKLRKLLAGSINLRRTPKLRFYLDKSDENYQKISELLDQK